MFASPGGPLISKRFSSVLKRLRISPSMLNDKKSGADKPKEPQGPLTWGSRL